FKQSGETRLKCIVILPLAEIRDKIFPHLGGQIVAAVGIEALPFADLFEVDEPDGEEFASILRLLRLEGPADLGLYPFAIHAGRRQHKQELLMHLNGVVYLFKGLAAALHVLRREPDAEVLLAHPAMQFSRELLIFRTIADKAG